ncbi:hypothetical protein GCM10009549_18110 [Streptomyces thermoalcalitolerans]|uniref:Uncharacterized protein n=2 Tax=Streptomyces thermoalcalitolerans TaxID=65605 RepID=A0ABP3YZP5_9ACTN
MFIYISGRGETPRVAARTLHDRKPIDPMSDSATPPPEGNEQATGACCAAIAALQRRVQQGAALHVRTDTGDPATSLPTESVHDA